MGTLLPYVKGIHPIKASSGKWTPMEAARLLIGRSAADGIRNDMGDHWLNVAIAAHLAESQDQGEWSPVHATLKSWLDYQADRLDAAEYNQRLVEHAEDVRGQYLRIH